MASLHEMMMYANYKGNIDNPAPQILDAGIGGFFQGQAAGRQAGKAQLDAMLKIMEISEKMKLVKIEERKQQFNENMDKLLGGLPLGDTEHSASMATLSAMLGSGKEQPTVHTPDSKLGKIVRDMDMSMTRSERGWEFKFAPKKKSTVGGAAHERNKRLEENDDAAYAEMMAQNEEYQKQKDEIKRTMGPNAAAGPLSKLKVEQMPIHPDILSKYREVMPEFNMSIAHAMRTGNPLYKQMMAKVQKPQAPDRSAALMAEVAKLKAQLDQAEASSLSSIFNMGRKFAQVGGNLSKLIYNPKGKKSKPSANNRIGEEIEDTRKELVKQTAKRKKRTVWDPPEPELVDEDFDDEQ